jgi:glycerol-3-phosphate acyltransferase PlsY
MVDLVLVLLAYVIGSVPTGVVLGRLAGVDVRAAGSGNIGATNVARTAGRVAGLATLIGDAGKGIVAVSLARAAGSNELVPPAAALAAVFGHIFPLFLRFRGGKGVATGLGACLGLAPAAAALPLLVFGATFAARRTVSLASMAAAAAAPASMALFAHGRADVVVSALIAIAIVARHRDNIRRLRAGVEPRFEGSGTARSGPAR